MQFKLTLAQIDWVKAMQSRYFEVTGIHITATQVILRTLEHGYTISENEMAAIEQGVRNPFIPNKYGELKLIPNLK